jgi:hypothetical protein
MKCAKSASCANYLGVEGVGAVEGDGIGGRRQSTGCWSSGTLHLAGAPGGAVFGAPEGKGRGGGAGGASLSLSPESFLSLSPEESFVEPGGFAGVSSTAGIDSQQLPLKMT